MSPHNRNPGTRLDRDWIDGAHVNRSAVERRAATHSKRRSIKKEWQAAWLLRAMTCIDLTTLAGDDTPGKVQRMSAKARQPLRPDLVEALGVGELGLTVAAVCVYHRRVADAVAALKDTNIPVAAVSTGFPAGLSPFKQRLQEIDIVISREHVLTGNWQALHDEVCRFREACGDAHMKSILATGELGTLQQVYQASLVCMMAGADFIKTSTGKEKVNATFEVGFVMVRAIRDYLDRTGHKVGFKPAGGISKAKDALYWLALMKEELGDEWTHPDMFRFGASSLLTDIERQLSHHVTGRYAARHHMPMG